MAKKSTLFLFLFIFTVVISGSAQVICGTSPEGGSITLTAPAGNTFTSIEFASYGTPDGTCGAFTLGGCDEPNSVAIVEAVFLGQNSATIGADNGTFGDPCGGTFKRLYIQARYSSTLPVTLVSFTAQKTSTDKVLLTWKSENEVNFSHYSIERSTDGITFQEAGQVAANGAGTYSFFNTIAEIIPAYYYRLKMVDIDGKKKYSNIVRINSSSVSLKLTLFPNPAENLLTILSNKKQPMFITNMAGQVVENRQLINGNQTININGWPAGIYFVKTQDEVIKFIKR